MHKKKCGIHRSDNKSKDEPLKQCIRFLSFGSMNAIVNITGAATTLGGYLTNRLAQRYIGTTLT